MAKQRMPPDIVDHRQSQLAHPDGAGGGTTVESGRRHIAITDGLDLFDGILLAERIEMANQPIQKFYNLLRRPVMGRTGKTDEICKHHAEHLDAVGDALLARFQTLGDRHRHHRLDQGFGSLVLVLQLEFRVAKRSQRIEQRRGIDRDRIEQDLTGQGIAKFFVARDEQSLRWCKIG